MDKVKQFWQTVVKEREDFWVSFFKKYENVEDNKFNNDKASKEEEKEDSGVIQSYMDKSSSRIKTLLKLATDEDKDTVDVPTDGDPSESAAAVQKYYEEQCGDSLEAVTADCLISSDEESNSEATEKLTTTNSDQKKSLPIRLKIPKPEILADKASKEDEKEDSGDIRSYMDKSSSRIKTLLNLAADEDKDAVDFPTDGYPSESAAASVQKYYEEQSGDSLEAVTADSSISSDVESNSEAAEKLTTSDLDQKKSFPLWLKIPKPEFVLEILAEDEEDEYLNKSNKTLSPVKKLVLFESALKFDKHDDNKKLSDSEGEEDEDNKSSISLNGILKNSVHRFTPIVFNHKPNLRGKSQPSPSPVKKLKFHDTSLQHETGKRKINISPHSSSKPVKLSQSWNDGNKSSSSSRNIDSTFVCRRPVSKRNQLVSAPKRFKLV